MDIFLRPISYYDALTLFQKKKRRGTLKSPAPPCSIIVFTILAPYKAYALGCLSSVSSLAK